MIVDCGIKYRRTLTIWPQDDWRLFVSRNSCLKYLFMFYMRTHFCLYARFRITKLAYIALLSLLLLQINEAKKSQKRFDYVHSQPERDTFLLILIFFFILPSYQYTRYSILCFMCTTVECRVFAISGKIKTYLKKKR